MDRLAQDVRYAFRTLVNARGFTIIAVITLALGIGANTAMFSVVNAVLLRPLPFPEPQRIVSVNTMSWSGGTPRPTADSYADLADYKQRSHSLAELASYYHDDFSLTGNGEPILLRGQVVGAGLFRALGVRPEIGHDFLPDDDQPGHHVAIISDALWKSRFHSDRNIVGQTIDLSGKPYTVAGVAPPRFQFPVQSEATQVWVTASRDVEVSPTGDKSIASQRGAHFLAAVGRLKAGASREQAEAELSAIAASLAKEYPNTNLYEKSVRVQPVLNHLIGDVRRQLLILLAAVGCVLLIACANVANLVLTRSSARSREIAVRAALGATRGRIVRQLVTESLVLASAGAISGTVIAAWAVSAVVKLYPQNLPRMQEIGIDPQVLAFTAALAVITAILFGLIPALQTSRPNLSEAMREGGRGAVGDTRQSRLRSGLVIAETAVGVMLLIGAGLLLRSLYRLSNVDLGLDPSHVLTANFALSQTRYNSDQQDRFYTDLFNRLRAVPGVEAVGGTANLPLANDDWSISFDIVERRLPESQQPSAGFYVISPGVLQALKIPVLSGRAFDEHDTRDGNPVMLINREFARRYFPGENPIGKMIEIGAGEGKARAKWKTREVVGVIGNIRTLDVGAPPRAAFFVPLSQLIWGPPTLVIRTSGDPAAVVPALRRTLSSMEPDAPLYDIKTLEDYLALDLGRARFQTVLLGLFAGVALLLTAIGLYGVIAHGVVQRTHEIGVRMALGASRTDVLHLVLNRGLMLTLAGVGIGVVGALALARFIQSLLYEIPPRDPLTYAVVCVTLGAVALLASYIPALRATRVDPMIALRYD